MPALRRLATWLATESGLKTLLGAPRDTHILLLSRFLRTFAYGAVALILALFLAELEFSDERIGVFMTLTLLGDVCISLMLTLAADRLGRRRTLVLGAILMAASGPVFATIQNYYLLVLAAAVGVISPSGNEVGPFRAIEESTLAHMIAPEGRPDVFVWYVIIANLGTASGLLICGSVVERLQSLPGWSIIDAYHAIFWLYTGIGLAKLCLTLCLSQECELTPKATNDDVGQARESEPLLPDQDSVERSPENGLNGLSAKQGYLSRVSTKSRWILLRLCLLFSVDSLASGMIPYSLLNYYMDRKFHLPKDKLGLIMSASLFASSVANMLASPLSKSIGLVKTMAFTHLPSAILLALLPIPGSLAITICLLVGRASLNSMDQAPRSAFLSAVVLPAERTAVMGIANVVKTLSQSGGPVITGFLAGHSRFWVAFVTAGALKAAYDVGLLVMFVNTKLHLQADHASEHSAQSSTPNSRCGSEGGSVSDDADEPRLHGDDVHQ